MTQLLRKQPRNELPLDKLLKQATSNDDTYPSDGMLSEISDYTFNESGLNKVMKYVLKTLETEDRKWRKIQKDLKLILFLINHGSSECVNAFKKEKERIMNLKTFSYFENDLDRSLEIKELARNIIHQLRDEVFYSKDSAKKVNNTIGNTNSSMMTPTRSTLDSLKNTPPQNSSQSSQNERKASIDYFLRPDDNGRERISSFHEEPKSTEASKLNSNSKNSLISSQTKYVPLDEATTLPPPPGESLITFQKNKSLPVSIDLLDTIENSENSPIKPIRLQFNQIQNVCNVNNQFATQQDQSCAKQSIYASQNQSNLSIDCNLLDINEPPLKKHVSFPNQNIVRKPSFSELYSEYKKNKETSAQKQTGGNNQSVENLNKSLNLLESQVSKNISQSNQSDPSAKFRNEKEKMNDWVDSLMISSNLIRSKTTIIKEAINTGDLTLRKSVSVNLQSDRKYLDCPNQNIDLNKCQEIPRAYLYTSAEELEELYMEFSTRNSITSSTLSENNERVIERKPEGKCLEDTKLILPPKVHLK